jgi:hypothetical protein
MKSVQIWADAGSEGSDVVADAGSADLADAETDLVADAGEGTDGGERSNE